MGIRRTKLERSHAQKLAQNNLLNFENGTVKAVLSDGRIIANVSDRAFDYPPLHPSNLDSGYKSGDPISIGFGHGSRQLPFILGKNINRSATRKIRGGGRPGFHDDDGGPEIPIFYDGLWLQAEGLAELSFSNFRTFRPVDWSEIVGHGITGDLSFEQTPGGMRIQRGHVYWTADNQAGIIYAFAYWAKLGADWWLALKVGTLGGDAVDVLLEQLNITDGQNTATIYQGGVTYEGGRDHGCLGLWFEPGVGKIFLLGPLGQSASYRTLYTVKVQTTEIKKFELTKTPVHTSLGYLDFLIGWWGGNSSPSYYTDPNIKIMRSSGNTLTNRYEIDRNQLTLGDNFYGCHPRGDGARARGRWPWKATSDDPVVAGEFAIWALSAAYGNVSVGSGVPVNGVIPDDVHNVSILKTTQADLNFVSAIDGSVNRIFTSLVASEDDVNIDSLVFYDLYAPQDTPPAFGHIQIRQGWAFTEGCTQEIIFDPEISGPRVRRGNFPYAQDVPHFLHPLTNRNPGDRNTPSVNVDEATGNGVFDWRPDSFVHQPMGVFSKRKHHLSVYSVPHLQNYGSTDESAYFHYNNPAHDAWFILETEYQADYDAWEAGGSIGDPPVAPIGDPPRFPGGPPDFEENGSREPLFSIEESWRLMRSRFTFKTYFKHLDEEGANVCTKQINQTFLGLRDGPATLDDTTYYRDYNETDVLDQVWQYEIMDSPSDVLYENAPDLFALAFLMDLRDVDSEFGNHCSEARPWLRIYDYTTSGTLACEIDLLPSVRYATGEARYAYYHYFSRPKFNHGVDTHGFPFIDVFLQYRQRTSLEDDIGDPDTHLLRVVQLRWKDDTVHDVLSNPIITTVDLENVILDDQQLEGTAYVDNKILFQFDNKRAHFENYTIPPYDEEE